MRKARARGIAATAGAVVHLLVFWWIVVDDERIDSLYCIEASCWSLIALDLPVSILFLGGDHKTVTWGSAVAGTLWWGVLAVGLYTVIARALARRRSSSSDRNP